MTNSIRKKTSSYIFIFIIIFHLTNTILWLKKNEIPQGKDTYSHLYNLSKISKLVICGQPDVTSNQKRHTFLYNLIFGYIYPPCYYYVALLLKIFFNWITPKIILLTSSIFFIFLLWAVYNIGNFLEKDSGLLSVFLLSFYPPIFLSMRNFNLELAVCAMVALCFYFLFKTNNFKNKRYSLLLGVSFGVGMLVKYTAFFFLAIPILLIFLKIIFERKEQIINFSFFIVVSMIISLVFYHHCPSVLHLLEVAINTNYASNRSLIGTIFYFVNIGIIKNIGVLFTYLIIVSLILISGMNWNGKRVIYCWAFGPIILVAILLKSTHIFNLFYHVQRFNEIEASYYPLSESYILPILPAMALISGVAICKIDHKLIKKIIVLFLVLCVSFIYYPYASKGETDASLGNDILSLQDAFKKLGDFKYKIAVISLGPRNIDFYTYIGAFLLLWSKNYPIIIDFYAAPVLFMSELDNFDVIILASDHSISWPDYPLFESNLKNVCKSRNFNLIVEEKEIISFDGKNMIVSKNAISRIINKKEELKLYEKLKFYNSFFAPVYLSFYTKK